MFNREDMMISLVVAEKVVEETKNRLKNEAKGKESSLVSIINNMKAKSTVEGRVSIFNNNYFDIGEKTGLLCNGLELYTGDEVEFKTGKKGVVVRTDVGYMIYTNKEVSRIVDNNTIDELRQGIRQIFSGIEGAVDSNKLAITKHFNELEDGEEYAKGRSGGAGFTVQLLP